MRKSFEMPKTLIAYPLVVSTGMAIGSGEWTVTVFLTGATIGLLAATVFEATMWLIQRQRGSGPR